GVPDIYEGNDLWDFSLVDPDNRRPVDFPLRERLLRSLEKASTSELVEKWEDGRIKQLVTYRALQLRRERPNLFSRAAYYPLVAGGPRRRHVVAFQREIERQSILVLAPVLLAGLTGGEPTPPAGESVWRTTSVPVRRPGVYRDVIAGREIEI